MFGCDRAIRRVVIGRRTVIDFSGGGGGMISRIHDNSRRVSRFCLRRLCPYAISRGSANFHKFSLSLTLFRYTHTRICAYVYACARSSIHLSNVWKKRSCKLGLCCIELCVCVQLAKVECFPFFRSRPNVGFKAVEIASPIARRINATVSIAFGASVYSRKINDSKKRGKQEGKQEKRCGHGLQLSIQPLNCAVLILPWICANCSSRIYSCRELSLSLSLCLLLSSPLSLRGSLSA